MATRRNAVGPAEIDLQVLAGRLRLAAGPAGRGVVVDRGGRGLAGRRGGRGRAGQGHRVAASVAALGTGGQVNVASAPPGSV